MQKLYQAGGQTVAVRTLEGEQDTLQWVLTDHLGSINVTANADGSWNSQIQYTAFGEIRNKSGVTPSDYRYTGQLSQMDEIGLLFYVARWYDPALAHFAQADIVVPDPGNPVTYDRFSYARGNPILYNDPDGHDVGCPQADPRCQLQNNKTDERYTLLSNKTEAPNYYLGVISPGQKAANWAEYHKDDVPQCKDEGCTYFVSNALLAGGLQPDDIWFQPPPGDCISSLAWVSTPALLDYLGNVKGYSVETIDFYGAPSVHYGLMKLLEDPNRKQILKPGDIVIYSEGGYLPHAAIVIDWRVDPNTGMEAPWIAEHSGRPEYPNERFIYNTENPYITAVLVIQMWR